MEVDGRSVTVPSSWSVALGVGERTKVTMAFGSATASAQFQVADGPSRSVIVGRLVAEELHLQTGMRLQFSYDPASQVMALGPILGLFTVADPVYLHRSPDIRDYRPALYRPLMQLAEKRGMLAYLFSPQDINWTDRTVWGYRMDHGRWGSARYPLPDVVYDRIPSRMDERRADVIRTKERLQKELPYFNPSYLNKWDVHGKLAKRAETRAYLPDTRLLNTINDLAYFLTRYEEVYLKPTMSSIGKGIMKITKNDRGYLLHHRKGQAVKRSFYPSVTQLFAAIRPLIRKRAYLVQQGIDLATYRGHHYDVRTLAQKDGAGKWTVTGMAARVAAHGAYVTHVPNGGTRQPLKRVVASDRFAEISQQLHEAGRVIPMVLEDEMGKTFGEMSLDLAVDRKGEIWLIEANAKPFRFDEPVIRGVARQRLLDYACYLANHS